MQQLALSIYFGPSIDSQRQMQLLVRFVRQPISGISLRTTGNNIGGVNVFGGS